MGEEPQYFRENLHKHCKEADYLLILGTSLSINPFAEDLHRFWSKDKAGLIMDYASNENFTRFLAAHQLVFLSIGDLNEM